MSWHAEEFAAGWDRALVESAPSLAASFRDAMYDARLAFGDRPVCQVLRPLFVDSDAFERLARDGARVRRALSAVAALPGVDEALGFSPAERALFALDPDDGEPDAIGRLDAFFGEDGRARFIEYNGESPGGIAFGDALGELFEGLEPFTRLALRPRRIEAKRATLAALLDHHAARLRRRGEAPRAPRGCAIVDFREAKTRREFELFADFFAGEGLPAIVVDPSELRIEDGTLRAGSLEIDLVYRRLLSSDILREPERAATLLEAARADLACIANGFGGHRLSHKGLFAYLSNPDRRGFRFDDATEETLAATVPWTRLVLGDETEPPGGGPRRPLTEILEGDRERLVLKPGADYGGRGVTLGWTADDATWGEAVDRAGRERGWIVQERVAIPRRSFPRLDGGETRLAVDVGPYVVGGSRVVGAGVRLAGGDLLNVSAGSGSAVPMFLVDVEK
ncbi:MAG: hypothetical protein R3F20_07495 [Planctomycetota bacterium]